MDDVIDITDAQYEPSNNEIRQFSYKAQTLRVVRDPRDTIWLNAADICRIVGLKSAAMTVEAVDDAHKTKEKFDSQTSWYVTPKGLRGIAYRSIKYEEPLKDLSEWVDKEVVPIMEPEEPEDALTQAIQGELAPDQATTHLVRALVEDLRGFMHQNMLELKARFLEEQQALISSELQKQQEYFEKSTKGAYENARKFEKKALETKKELEKAEEMAEKAEKHAEHAESVQSLTVQSHRDAFRQVTEENRELKEKLETVLESKKRWEKRARKWGRRLVKDDHRSLYDDHDLYRLKESMLND